MVLTKKKYFAKFGTVVLIYFVLKRILTVGIATGYGVHDQGVGIRVPVGATIFTSLCRPDRLWGPPNISSEYLWLFPGGKAAGA
jgi:hypothetical protein